MMCLTSNLHRSLFKRNIIFILKPFRRKTKIILHCDILVYIKINFTQLLIILIILIFNIKCQLKLIFKTKKKYFVSIIIFSFKLKQFKLNSE